MLNIIKKQYQKLFNKLSILNEHNDTEYAHMLQDRIYRKFIRDIVNNKIKTKDIKEFAENMNKYVVKKDKGRWYS